MPFWMQAEDPEYYPEVPEVVEFTEDDYDELNVPEHGWPEALDKEYFGA